MAASVKHYDPLQVDNCRMLMCYQSSLYCNAPSSIKFVPSSAIFEWALFFTKWMTPFDWRFFTIFWLFKWMTCILQKLPKLYFPSWYWRDFIIRLLRWKYATFVHHVENALEARIKKIKFQSNRNCIFFEQLQLKWNKTKQYGYLMFELMGFQDGFNNVISQRAIDNTKFLRMTSHAVQRHWIFEFIRYTLFLSSLVFSFVYFWLAFVSFGVFNVEKKLHNMWF